MVDDPASARSGTAPAIVIDLDSGKRVCIFAPASPALAAATLKALR